MARQVGIAADSEVFRGPGNRGKLPVVRVLVVGGCCSGVGKTAVVCRLLEALRRWGAIKVSPTHAGAGMPAHHHGLDAGAYRLDREPLEDPGRDTGRFRIAGSGPVVWVRSRSEALPDAMREALACFSELPGVIVEGNSAARACEVDGIALVARVDQREIKDSARDLARRADWIVLNRPGAVEAATVDAASLERNLGARPTHEIDAELATDAGTRAFVDAVRAWARR